VQTSTYKKVEYSPGETAWETTSAVNLQNRYLNHLHGLPASREAFDLGQVNVAGKDVK
jgi:hypothetical protein